MTRWFLIGAFLFVIVAFALTFGRAKPGVIEPDVTTRAPAPRDRPTTGLTKVGAAANQGDYTTSKGTGVVLPAIAPKEEEQSRCKEVVAHLAELGIRADKGARERLADPSLRQVMDGQCEVVALGSEVADCIMASKDLDAVESCTEVREPETSASLDELYKQADKLGVDMPEREPDEADDDDDDDDKNARGPAPPD